MSRKKKILLTARKRAKGTNKKKKQWKKILGIDVHHNVVKYESDDDIVLKIIDEVFVEYQPNVVIKNDCKGKSILTFSIQLHHQKMEFSFHSTGSKHTPINTEKSNAYGIHVDYGYLGIKRNRIIFKNLLLDVLRSHKKGMYNEYFAIKIAQKLIHQEKYPFEIIYSEDLDHQKIDIALHHIETSVIEDKNYIYFQVKSSNRGIFRSLDKIKEGNKKIHFLKSTGKNQDGLKKEIDKYIINHLKQKTAQAT